MLHVARLGLDRNVHCVMGEVQEKRPVAGTIDDLQASSVRRSVRYSPDLPNSRCGT